MRSHPADPDTLSTIRINAQRVVNGSIVRQWQSPKVLKSTICNEGEITARDPLGKLYRFCGCSLSAAQDVVGFVRSARADRRADRLVRAAARALALGVCINP